MCDIVTRSGKPTAQEQALLHRGLIEDVLRLYFSLIGLQLPPALLGMLTSSSDTLRLVGLALRNRF